MEVLVTGASGLLGSNVALEAATRGHSVLGTYYTTDPDLGCELVQCDLGTPGGAVELLERAVPDVVVNCAAVTDVDECERDPETARRVNTLAPARIAEWCAGRDVTLVHVSTDYVFDGTRAAPYAESDDPRPLQVYGETKAEADRRVRTTVEDAIVVRPSFVYGVHRADDELAGFAAWVRDELHSDGALPLFTDQHVTPSRAGQVATTVFELLSSGASGTFHVAATTCATPYEFGRSIADEMGVEPSIVESSRTDVDREAPRPENTCLDVTAVAEALGRPQPTLAEDLETVAPLLDQI